MQREYEAEIATAIESWMFILLVAGDLDEDPIEKLIKSLSERIQQMARAMSDALIQALRQAAKICKLDGTSQKASLIFKAQRRMVSLTSCKGCNIGLALLYVHSAICSSKRLTCTHCAEH